MAPSQRRRLCARARSKFGTSSPNSGTYSDVPPQASGEAAYCSDAVRTRGELSAAFALCDRGGQLSAVALDASRRVPGCVDVLDRDELLRAYGSLALDDGDDHLLYGQGDRVFRGARVARHDGVSPCFPYNGAILSRRGVL